MRGWKMLAVLLVLLLTASTSHAAGFRLPEAGVKAMGMGFAFTAQADDPSAIYFNPAGLTQLEGSNLMLGVTYVKENGAEFSGTAHLPGPSPETQKDLNFYIPNAYYTYTSKSLGMAFGIGIFAPFGLGQEYQNRDTSIFRDQVTKIDLQTIVVNPTIAFDINEYLSFGAGIDYLWANVTYEKTGVVPSGAPYGGPGQFYTKLDGSADAWGYNFGVLVKPTKNVKIGLSYRSQFLVKAKDLDFSASSLVGTANGLIFPMGTTKATATLGLPATAAVGISYTYNRLTFELDGDWTFWHSYSALNIDNKSVPTYTKHQPKNWKDVCALRTGVEYRVTDPLALRAGFVYDPTPAPGSTMGPELPDSTRLNYMLGAGYKVGRWTIDLAGMYIDKKDRTENNAQFNGTWKGDAWLAGLDIGYKF